jgi:hypothetical protein
VPPAKVKHFKRFQFILVDFWAIFTGVGEIWRQNVAQLYDKELKPAK